jgi:hypothetical protein
MGASKKMFVVCIFSVVCLWISETSALATICVLDNAIALEFVELKRLSSEGDFSREETFWKNKSAEFTSHEPLGYYILDVEQDFGLLMESAQ